MTRQQEDGYPASSEDDLDAGQDLTQTLSDADREAVGQRRVRPEGRRPEGSAEDEDRLGDAHTAEEVDDAGARHHLGGGSGPVDSANFNDNAADWSRARG